MEKILSPGTVHRDETYENFLSQGTVHMDGNICYGLDEKFLSPGTVHRDENIF